LTRRIFRFFKTFGSLLLVASLLSACSQKGKVKVNWFTGKDQPLQSAMDADDVNQLHAALQNGASVDAKGVHGVTPLEYAIGHFSKQTYAELLRQRANPNQKDEEGDNAVTLAARAFAKDQQYLVWAIQAGGDPNTRGPNNDPIIAYFKAAHNLQAIQLLHSLGANINIRRRTRRPLIIDAALTDDWDIVFLLLRLGASYDYPNEPMTLADCFKNQAATPPDSPLYGYKKSCWEFLSSQGVTLPPLDAPPK
jgi:ankyrin repeat protein